MCVCVRTCVSACIHIRVCEVYMCVSKAEEAYVKMTIFKLMIKSMKLSEGLLLPLPVLTCGLDGWW